MIRIHVVVVLALVACKKPSIEQEAESLRDRMCACTDAACAEKVDRDAQRLGERITREGKAGATSQRLEAAGIAMEACHQRATGVSRIPPELQPDAAPTIDAPPPDAVPPSKYGYCKVTFTGAVTRTIQVALEAKDAGSEHWLSAEEAAAGKQRVAEAEKREGIDLGESHRMLEFKCADATAYADLIPTLKTMDSKLRPFNKMVGDYPITDKDDIPNAFHGSIGSSDLNGIGLGPSTGTLHVTRFDKGELAATFEVDIMELGDNPRKAHVEGVIEYHCADYDRCGRGGP